MSVEQAIRRPGTRQPANTSSVAGFNQSVIQFPGVSQQLSSFQTNTYLSGIFLDQRTASPTYNQYVNYGGNYPVYWTTSGSAIAQFNPPTMVLQVSPGLEKHDIFAYFLFNPASIKTINYPLILTGFLNNSQTPQPVYSGVQDDQDANFTGTLTGTFTFWSNGAVVGKLPFSLYGNNPNVSAASLVFDAGVYTAGIVLSGKGGGLQVNTDFESLTRQLPAITFRGIIDTVTVDMNINYAGAGTPGGFYCGILSRN
jgi:hypothetical protein